MSDQLTGLFSGHVQANQPKSFQSSRDPHVHNNLICLFHGYIANRRQIEASLRNRICLSPLDNDVSLFAEAYRLWGIETQRHVFGEYAIAILDNEDGSLFLSHDTVGLQAVFYTQNGFTFAFGTHLKPLRSFLYTNDLDEEYIADYLATGSVAGNRTPYPAIKRLLPGESLLWKDGRIRLISNWHFPSVPISYRDSDQAYEEKFRELVFEGVQSACSGVSHLWTELSGGLDSSTVASVAAQLGIPNLGAFSVIYSKSKTADERAWISHVLHDYGLSWHNLDGDLFRPFSTLPSRDCDEPLNILTSSELSRQYQDLAKSAGISIVLSGEGGDQLLGEDLKPIYLADLLLSMPCRLWSELHQWRKSLSQPRPTSYLFLSYVLAPRWSHARRRSLLVSGPTSFPDWINPGYLSKMNILRRSQRQHAPSCRSIERQYLTEQIWKSGLSSAMDRSSALEFRYPLLYVPLIEYIMSLPPLQRIRPGENRSLQRRSLPYVLPEVIRLRRTKAGPAQAEIEELRSGGEWRKILLNPTQITGRGYVDKEAWIQTVNGVKFGLMPSMKHFVATATLEIWLSNMTTL